MKTELEKKLIKAHPLLYRNNNKNTNFLHFSFECSDGWFQIIWDLSEKLEKIIQKFIDDNPNLICYHCYCEKKEHDKITGKCNKIHKLPYCLSNNNNNVSSYIIPNWKEYFFNSFRKNRGPTFKYFWFNIVKKWVLAKFLILTRKGNKFLFWLYKKYNIGYYKSCHCNKYMANYPVAIQVKEKFGCYDEQTEVLTVDGWKFFKDVTYQDKFATLNKNKELQYYKCSDIISYDYNGMMYELKTRGVDLLVTPNHNLYCAKGTYYNSKHSPPKKVEYDLEFQTPDKLFGKNKRFIKGALWKGESPTEFVLPEDYKEWDREYYGTTRKFWKLKTIKIESWLKFLGWYIAEGCSNVDSGDISIACNNTDAGKEKTIISKVIKDCGFTIKTSMEDRSALTFKIYEKRLAKWLTENCGSKSNVKKVPKFIKTLNPELITVFLDSLYQGDGHKAKTSNILTTISKTLANDIQELLLKAGYTSRIYAPRLNNNNKHNDYQIYGNYPIYAVNWLTDSNSHNTKNKGLSTSSVEQWTNYQGKVYCVTVPNNTLYVRRNGIPVWCGNSLRFYMTNYTDEIDKAIKKAERLSDITCEVCGEPGTLRNDGWQITLCDDCNKRDK